MSANACVEDCRRADLVRSRLSWLLWVTPTLLFGLGMCWSSARVWLWVPALATAGAACAANAARCRRLHCFITGPVFLLGALSTVLDAARIVVVDAHWVAGAMVVGTIIAYSIEQLHGTYVGVAREGEKSPR